MNFLAHLTLSQDDEDLMLGNFIADGVKSSEWGHFKPEVVQGIQLHHKIDFFTDNHPIVERSKKLIRPKQGKYSPVVVDILYDHFLARNFEEYHPQALEDFASESYALLNRRWDELPPQVQHLLPHMEAGNWLVNYANRNGLQRVFSGMSRRAKFDNDMDRAVHDLEQHYQKLKNDFEAYFPLLRDYVAGEIEKLHSQ